MNFFAFSRIFAGLVGLLHFGEFHLACLTLVGAVSRSSRSSVLVKPQVSDPTLRAKLSKGMGHNTYGEIAWPNDLLYMFPVCILGVLGISTSLAVL